MICYDRFEPVMEAAKQHKVKVRGYLSCVLGCPFEGKVDPDTVADLTGKLLEMGCSEVSLGDTIGVGTPGSTSRLLQTISERGISMSKIAVHFHDTYGQAL